MIQRLNGNEFGGEIDDKKPFWSLFFNLLPTFQVIDGSAPSRNHLFSKTFFGEKQTWGRRLKILLSRLIPYRNKLEGLSL